MTGMKELAISAIILILGFLGASYALPKGQNKIMVQHALNTISTVNVIRDWSKDYAILATTQDYQSINFEELDNRKLIPTGSTINGTGDTSEYIAPFDSHQNYALRDPNAGILGSQGKFIEIIIDSSGSNFNSDEFKNWEDRVETGLEDSGGLIQSNTDKTDGIITVRYE